MTLCARRVIPSAMLFALPLALADLFDRRLRPIWLKSLMAMIAAMAVLSLASFFGLRALLLHLIANSEFAGIIGALGALFGAWLLWRVIALAVLQFFADEVVSAIEARHYPAQADNARPLGWRAELRRASASAGRATVYNLLGLPFAIALLPTGVGAPMVFLAINALLLGRELQDMVWLRHGAAINAPAPLGRPERWALGGVTAMLLTVPIVNFAAPFLGAACAVHLIHRKGWRHAV